MFSNFIVISIIVFIVFSFIFYVIILKTDAWEAPQREYRENDKGEKYYFYKGKHWYIEKDTHKHYYLNNKDEKVYQSSESERAIEGAFGFTGALFIPIIILALIITYFGC